MNCFNIREVEALLKGRFFPDLFNTHDHRRVLNKTIVRLRFKTNNLDVVEGDTLLFYQYPLLTAQLARLQVFTTSLYERGLFGIPLTHIPTKAGLGAATLGILEAHFPGREGRFLPIIGDTHAFLKVLFTPNTIKKKTRGEIKGSISINEFFLFWPTYLKSEWERLWITYHYMYDLNKAGSRWLTWFLNFRFNLLDKFLYGYMENNRATGLHLMRHWPVYEPIAIQTEGGFIEFYVTAIHRVLAMTLFLYAEVIMNNLATYGYNFLEEVRGFIERSYYY